MTLERDIWNSPRTPFGPFGARGSHSLAWEREFSLLSPHQFRQQQQFTEDLIGRLGLAYELKGHEGCVNCISWNEEGTLLASGSDDCKVRVWNDRGKCQHVVATGHTGNIFGVKFLPCSSDNLIISCSADGTVRLHDLNFSETTYIFTCHVNRAKRVVTAPDSPFLFWSAGEDGLVIQYDLREPKRCDEHSCRNVLINLNPYTSSPELKSIACNPVRTELLALGATDCFTRLYDRRKLSLTTITRHEPPLANGFMRRHNTGYIADDLVLPAGCVRYFVPGHLPMREAEARAQWKTFSVTDVRFSADGAYILSNIGGEQVYLFDVNSQDRVGKSFNVQPASSHHWKNVTVLSGPAQALKDTANTFYHKKAFPHAVYTYDRAIQYCPQASVLYANRSAALMCRNWDGDSYQAVLDAYRAHLLNPTSDKAQFRLIKGLLQLRRVKEAKYWLEYFREQQSGLEDNQLSSPSFLKLEQDLASATKSARPKSTSTTIHDSTSFTEQESRWRSDAVDYERRFVGHCNTTTDIKEANFIGDRGQFIMAGSDDGKFFIWDRESTNLVKVIRGDSAIVNCLQAHPATCLIATSGIDEHIRIWAPQPVDRDAEEKEEAKSSEATRGRQPADSEEGAVGTAVRNVDRATLDNQRRMHADPWSVMMGNLLGGGNVQLQGGLAGAAADGPVVINPGQDCVMQ
ncbi:WD and tetratricopeptide repeats protein 1 [Hypsibius exemplaris]|uniref:WD and tetratricopeptide repeats protein 1 n=1 Tax=Hypsibius exemplaris TaxID=2072580 RepID=A0A1W0X2K7_HYPEX|nr:WD and tetratricopeptide repeats protein 1 [Hypsibius exemplaris]